MIDTQNSEHVWYGSCRNWELTPNPVPQSNPQPLKLESAGGRKQKSGLVNQAGDFRDEADRRAEAEKCTEQSNFKYLIIECLQKARSLLEHGSRAFSSDGIHFGYLCQVPFRHATALIPAIPQRTVIKKLLPPKCVLWNPITSPECKTSPAPCMSILLTRRYLSFGKVQRMFCPQCVEYEVLEKGSKGRHEVGKQIRV